MSLSKSDKGWVRCLMTIWAFLECLFFAGILYGWSSLVFIFKDEGIYANLCEQSFAIENDTLLKNITNEAVHQNGTDIIAVVTADNATVGNSSAGLYSINSTGEMTDVRKNGRVQCKEQDSMLSLCFTISSAIFCKSCVVMGYVNYKLGTRITRYIALWVMIYILIEEIKLQNFIQIKCNEGFIHIRSKQLLLQKVTVLI